MRLEKVDPGAYRLFADALRDLGPFLRPPHLQEFHNPGADRFLGRFKPLWMPLLYAEEFISENRRVLLLEVAEVEARLESGRLIHLRARADDRLATPDLPAEEGRLKAVRVVQDRHYSLLSTEGGTWYEQMTTRPGTAATRLGSMQVEGLEVEGQLLPVPELAERLRVYEEQIRAESIEVEPLEMERERPLEFVMKRGSEELRRMAEEAK